MKALLRGFSIANLMLLLFGGIFFGMTIQKGHVLQLLKPAHNYDEVLSEGLEEGDHVQGDIYYSLGQFATQSTYTQYEDYRTASKTAGYYYVIPVGDSGLAAIYVRKADKQIMDQITDETYAYLEGGASPQTVLHFNGVAVEMEENLKGLEAAFRKQLKEWQYSDQDIETIIQTTQGKLLVLEGPADVTTVYVMAGIGLLIIALAVFLFIRKYKKEKAWAAKKEEEWTQV